MCYDNVFTASKISLIHFAKLHKIAFFSKKNFIFSFDERRKKKLLSLKQKKKKHYEETWGAKVSLSAANEISMNSVVAAVFTLSRYNKNVASILNWQ